MLTPDDVAIAHIRAARDRLAGIAVRTPLVRLELPDLDADVWLKLENLQPIGSFKLRGAANAMLLAGGRRLAAGAYTASAGNMAQGVAWSARRFGVPCHVVVPEHAPRIKLEAIERLGGEVITVPFDRWWQTLVDHAFPGLTGLFVHPFSDAAVLAGNGTIGLEIVEDLPDVDTVLVPFGGGGLSCGIAAAVRAARPGVRVLACEVATAAPLSAALRSGTPQQVDYTRSFVDGIGARTVLPEIWPLARALLDGALVVSVEQTAAAVRRLVERARVVAEGAGAAPLAAAIAHRVRGRVVCVVSGGNIDTAVLADILAGRTPLSGGTERSR